MKKTVRQTLVSKINDILAMRITMLVGSIWAFYAFVIFGLTPILWPNYETEILYWSNFLQLVFLPVITVGTAIMNRDSERRAKEDHHTIRKEFELLQEAHSMLDKSLKEIAFGVRELLVRAHHQDTATLQSLVEGAAAPSKKASQS
ncbi:MAG: hypothetical protein R3D30_11575 [Hyphomicrobiales bacterium]